MTDDFNNNLIPDEIEAVEAAIDNMLGKLALDPIPAAFLNQAPGRDLYMRRRSQMARHAALRTVPHLVTTWKLPGSQLGNQVTQVREQAGVSATNVSINPSYREVMHTLAVDRFNSGQYAASKISSDVGLEREKLVNNSLYLMLLRDYYELLERTALVLSVQVSIMTDLYQERLRGQNIASR